MKRLGLIVAVAATLGGAAASRGAPASPGPRPGDTYAITIDREMSQTSGNGGISGNSSSTDRDTLIERVVAVRKDGAELQYDLPRDATAADRATNWQFPVRVFKPSHGAMQLLNRAELEGRVDGWLKAGGMTRENCGRWIFTWNAFRIDCDPQSVIKTLEAYDLASFEVREGALYQDPNAKAPAALVRSRSGAAFVAELAVDPEAVDRARAQTDVLVAELMRKPVTLEAALRERAKDIVSGTMTVTFEIGPAGEVLRRTTVARTETRRPNGRVETETVTQTLERRRIPAGA